MFRGCARGAFVCLLIVVWVKVCPYWKKKSHRTAVSLSKLKAVDWKQNKSFRHRKRIMYKTIHLVPFNEAHMTPMLLVCCFKYNQVAQSWDGYLKYCSKSWWPYDRGVHRIAFAASLFSMLRVMVSANVPPSVFLHLRRQTRQYCCHKLYSARWGATGGQKIQQENPQRKKWHLIGEWPLICAGVCSQKQNSKHLFCLKLLSSDHEANIESIYKKKKTKLYTTPQMTCRHLLKLPEPLVRHLKGR